VWHLLSPEGLVYIDAPDATRFAETMEAPFQEFSTEHINYFSPTSLTNLMEASGFRRIHLIQTKVEPSVGKVVCELKGLFRKRQVGSPEPEYDHDSETALTEYIISSHRLEEKVHQVIESVVGEGNPILVWGVGTHTQRLLATSQLPRAKIQVFIDSNPRYQGKTLLGRPVISPKDLGEYHDPILIVTRGYQQEIDEYIRSELRLPNKVIHLYQL
jgi:hypothetical protein